MRLWALPITILVAALLGAGIAVGVMALWEPWDGSPETPPAAGLPSATPEGPTPTLAPPTPTPYRQRLTGAEAAAKVQSKVNTDAVQNPIELPDGSIALIQVDNCEAADFNDFSLNWVVTCTQVSLNPNTGAETDPNVATWLVSDRTGSITRAN